MPDFFIIEAIKQDGTRSPYFVDVSAFEPAEGHGYAIKQAGRLCQRQGVVGCRMWQSTAAEVAELGADPISKAPPMAPRRTGLLRLPWLQPSS